MSMLFQTTLSPYLFFQYLLDSIQRFFKVGKKTPPLSEHLKFYSILFCLKTVFDIMH